MSAWLGCLLLATIPFEDVRQYHCETVELNRVFVGGDSLTLEQYIFWDGADCLDWRISHKVKKPRYNWQTGYWVMRWIEGGAVVEVKSRAFREVWSQDDRELGEREYYPEAMRRKVNPKEPK